MCQLFETIKIENGQLKNLIFHNKRLNDARKFFFNCSDFIDLKKIIKIPLLYKDNICKCKVLYSKVVEEIIFDSYKKKHITCLKLIIADDIEYSYKYKDRNQLETLFSKKGFYDDILIVKNKEITDTSFSNIVFYDGCKWFTPSNPLLKGTKRASLIERKKITPEIITVKDLKLFKKASLINAMLELGETTIENLSKTIQ